MDSLESKGGSSSSQETVVHHHRQSEASAPQQAQAETAVTHIIGSPITNTTATTPLDSPPSSPWLVNRPRAAVTLESGSDSETQARTTMTSGSTKHRDSSGKKQSSSKTKTTTTDDWTEITEPVVRRRIQNRNAQRKFRKFPPLLNNF